MSGASDERDLGAHQPDKRVVTIRDVALGAGVSVATVSRALNHSGYVSAEIRNIVEETADRLKYRPNRRARSLRRAKSMTIAAVVRQLENPVCIDFLRGVQRAAQQREYVVVIGETDGSDARGSGVLRRLADEGVDGVVLGGALSARDAQILADSAIPTFPDSSADSRAYIAAWEATEAEATRQMAQRLLELGHRRFALVIPQRRDWPESRSYRLARADTIRRELAEAGSEPVSLTVHGDNLTARCVELLTELAEAGPMPTAYIVFSHALTPPFLAALKEVGIAIPTDASLVTYGDSAWAAAYRPALSVVRHDTAAEAWWYTDRLIDRIEGNPATERPAAVDARFVDRESCVPPPDHRAT